MSQILDYIPEVKLIDECCPVCGCGNPSLSYELIRKWLYYCKRRHEISKRYSDMKTFKVDLIGYYHELNSDPILREVESAINSDSDLEGAYAIINGILDKCGCTEHGSSWYGSWLTEKGKKLLEALELAKSNDYDFNPDANWQWDWEALEDEEK